MKQNDHLPYLPRCRRLIFRIGRRGGDVLAQIILDVVPDSPRVNNTRDKAFHANILMNRIDGLIKRLPAVILDGIIGTPQAMKSPVISVDQRVLEFGVQFGAEIQDIAVPRRIF